MSREKKQKNWDRVNKYIIVWQTPFDLQSSEGALAVVATKKSPFFALYQGMPDVLKGRGTKAWGE